MKQEHYLVIRTVESLQTETKENFFQLESTTQSHFYSEEKIAEKERRFHF